MVELVDEVDLLLVDVDLPVLAMLQVHAVVAYEQVLQLGQGPDVLEDV